MAKILIAFVVIAGAALFLLMKSGGDVSVGGEQHGAEIHATGAAEAPAQK